MHVDWLALSHPDQDHYGGFAFIARNFSPDEFWRVDVENRDSAYAALLATLDEMKVPVLLVDSTIAPRTIDGVRLVALNPRAAASTSRNNASMMLRLVYHKTSFLFTGDLEAAGEAALLKTLPDPRSTILKVPHHGSRTSSSPGFVAAVDPPVAAFSLGYKNRFHFPAPEVIERYRAHGTRIMRTDEDGAIEVNVSPDGVSIRGYRDGATGQTRLRVTDAHP
jgi:competence protein ComEC